MTFLRTTLYRWLFPRIHDAARYAVATIDKDEDGNPPPAHHVEASAAVLSFFVMHTLFGPVDIDGFPPTKPGSVEQLTDESMRMTASLAQMKYERGIIEARASEYFEAHVRSHNHLAAFLNECLTLGALLKENHAGDLADSARRMLDLARIAVVKPPVAPVSRETAGLSVAGEEMPAVTYGPATPSEPTKNPLATEAVDEPALITVQQTEEREPHLGASGVIGPVIIERSAPVREESPPVDPAAAG